MELKSRVELDVMRNPKKPEALVIKTYEQGVTTLNNQPIGSTPYEAIAALKKAITKLEEHGTTITATVRANKTDQTCECLLKSLEEQVTVPFGCEECCDMEA
jgi:hypothetical protein